jgi:dethiobiotin synthetase
VRGLFVAGTDTGVGKTEIARALLYAVRDLRPTPLKPIETGCEPDEPSDALALREAAGARDLPLDRVCPYRFRLPTAPIVAAQAENAAVSLDRIERIVREARPPVVIEGAGGLLVPIAREVARGAIEQVDPAERAPAEVLVTNLDLAERLGLPVVLVGRAGLGTLNHCALSAEALSRRGIELAFVVLNRVSPEDDASVQTNRRLVAEMTGAVVLGPTPYVPDARARPAALAPLVAPLVDTLRTRR